MSQKVSLLPHHPPYYLGLLQGLRHFYNGIHRFSWNFYTNSLLNIRKLICFLIFSRTPNSTLPIGPNTPTRVKFVSSEIITFSFPVSTQSLNTVFFLGWRGDDRHFYLFSDLRFLTQSETFDPSRKSYVDRLFIPGVRMLNFLSLRRVFTFLVF